MVSNITRNPKLVGAFAFVGFLFYMKNTNSNIPDEVMEKGPKIRHNYLQSLIALTDHTCKFERHWNEF